MFSLRQLIKNYNETGLLNKQVSPQGPDLILIRIHISWAILEYSVATSEPGGNLAPYNAPANLGIWHG